MEIVFGIRGQENFGLHQRRKGKKNPDKGSEIDPETKCLQAVGALVVAILCGVTAYLLYNGSVS